MKKRLLSFMMFLPLAMGISAQIDLDLPQLTSPKGVKVTDIGKCTNYVAEVLVKDSLTDRQDTVYQSLPEVVWQSEGEDIHRSTKAPRRALAPQFIKGKINKFTTNVTFYIFKYDYKSIDCNGNPVTLSGMAVAPDPKETSKVNNVVIGTHITITADSEAPSNQKSINPDKVSDWTVLFALAGENPGNGGFIMSGLNMFMGASRMPHLYKKQLADYRYNLVIMPDYEGYGITKDHAHPYLYQELTARQVVDGAQAAIHAYQTDEGLKNIRRGFRKDWKTAICGYSQGGSVAMATHRFMEQNNIDEEFHLTGSICGDGPYDLMATLMYYVGSDQMGKIMSMPVVLPLIVKGMIDSNPYMRAHKASDYFNPKFIETGILDWIGSKTMTTGDIENAFRKLYNEGKNGDKNYYHDILEPNGSAKMRKIMNQNCYEYFLDKWNRYNKKYKTKEGIPLPDKRGVMEDLHLALASNDMTEGWVPRHHILLFHSDWDTTVPYDNAERAKAQLGKWAVLHKSTLKHDHNDSGTDFFSGDGKTQNIRLQNLRVSIALGTIMSQPVKGQKEGSITSW